MYLLDEGMPIDKVYNTLIKEKTTTVSETIPGPKMIENRKYKNHINRDHNEALRSGNTDGKFVYPASQQQCYLHKRKIHLSQLVSQHAE